MTLELPRPILQGRKALVVFTDGADTTSQMPERDVVDYARSIEATVYCIGFKGPGSRGFLAAVLKPGLYALWTVFRDVAVDLFDARSLRFEHGDLTVIVDFAHNEAGITALLDVAQGIKGHDPVTNSQLTREEIARGDSGLADKLVQNWKVSVLLRNFAPRHLQERWFPKLVADAGFLLALERFGYDVTDEQKAVVAFQRRFRPDLIDGIIDGECRAKLLALLLPRPQ